MNRMLPLLIVLAGAPAPAAAQAVEKQHVLTITAADIDGGILAEITWDNGALLLQGVMANPDGSLSGRYLLVPAQGTELRRLKAHTEASEKYWERKARRSSPTGLGSITSATDAKMPMYGIASLETRMGDAHNMGGMQKKLVFRLGRLVLHERNDGREPYDGEFWGWSPAELNRVAYVDGEGDLWIARADGRDPRRILKGDFTLPAWSDDGKAIAVAERKDGGRRWDISVILLPEALRSVR
ncbi:MAG TPA: hypothetical protein VFK57_23005 [Vicinamibacterales bacterium]|nr:hypothetical protein [Vicinamibacterales bacterium]